ncbi:hypothetical protein PGTUg99_025243 [Puccinia graminis f. sp. tritici]|uniref:Uncharacterized protein n=1 Tax=Puccinia graminis f. sp. tritici TaxID=56615 RepID=A0A5B0PGM1_PUCGR|nr:hypothetical protein PGTUg99_025243 [Puccinia graminis f. sp. tritici]
MDDPDAQLEAQLEAWYNGLVDSPEPDTPEMRQFDWKQGDLAIKGFELLSAHLFHWPSTFTRDTPADLSIGRLRSKKDIHTQLHSSLLPLLRQHLNSIAEALDDLIELRRDPAPKIQRVLELQPNLHRILDQIIRTLDEIIPGKIAEPSQTNDQHFEEFKTYRLYGLDDCIRDRLEFGIINFLSNSRGIIEELKLPARKRFPASIGGLCFFNSAFNQTIKWLKGSELHIIPDLWEIPIRDTYEAHEEYFRLTHPEADPPMSHAAIQLARSIIPIIKLSKLFFQKLLREGLMERKQVPLFTEMCSHQMYSLHKSSEEYGESVMSLVFRLEDAHLYPPADTSSSLIQNIQALSSHFQSYVSLAELYMTPLFPDINGVSAQIYFKTWFITWNTLFLTATQNAIQAANVFAQT